MSVFSAQLDLLLPVFFVCAFVVLCGVVICSTSLLLVPREGCVLWLWHFPGYRHIFFSELMLLEN